MPRTRTKFIWPPPNLARDNSASTDSEQRQQQPHKKQKLESPSGTPVFASEQLHGASHTGAVPVLQNNDTSPAPSDGRESTQSSQVEWDPSSDAIPPSYEAVVRAYLRVPIEKFIESYQNWRRQGSIHDDFCMMCHRPRNKDLVPCYTCRRCFHDDCMPPGSHYNDSKQWYCAMCVRRNWHVQPPTMTPPASPRLSAQNSTAPDSSTADRKPPQGATAQDSQALSILAEISRSMHRDVSHSQAPAHGQYTTGNNNPSSASASMNITGNARNSFIPTPKSSARPSVSSPSTQTFSMLDSHARKSRFATLSTEVDSALWVLYRELESATSLRQRIAELESEVVKLRQDVSIRDNQIILSQRAAQPAPVSQAELEQLRFKAAKWDACAPELEQLRAKNEALERSLRDARAECASKDEVLNEWKGRLASLIGP